MHVRGFRVRQGLVDVGVPVGHHHQVAGVVGVEVHDHVTGFAAVQDEAFLVSALRREAAEDAALPFGFGSADSLDRKSVV